MIIAEHESPLIFQRKNGWKSAYRAYYLPYNFMEPYLVPLGTAFLGFGYMMLVEPEEHGKHQTGRRRCRADIAFAQRGVHRAQRVFLRLFQQGEKSAQTIADIVFVPVQSSHVFFLMFVAAEIGLDERSAKVVHHLVGMDTLKRGGIGIFRQVRA